MPGSKRISMEMKNNTESRGKNHQKVRLIAISISFTVGVSLMLVKFYVYRITHSSAILSDALESIINVVASAFAFSSIVFASKPPDECHPYGHGKIEYFSAGFEGALIILAALAIFKTGWSHILHPRQLPNLEKGLFILLGTSLINLILGVGLIRTGNQTSSLILIADGKHVMTDVYTSGGMLLGLFLAKISGWYWLDGMIACVAGLNILVSGTGIVRQSFNGLMNTSDPELLDEISGLLSKYRKKTWIDIHELRAWRAGNLIHIDFHLILPRDYSLEEAHREGKELEHLIKENFKGAANVLIHMDPCIETDCPICNYNLCKLRTQTLKETIPWTRKTLTSKAWRGERLSQIARQV